MLVEQTLQPVFSIEGSSMFSFELYDKERNLVTYKYGDAGAQYPLIDRKAIFSLRVPNAKDKTTAFKSIVRLSMPVPEISTPVPNNTGAPANVISAGSFFSTQFLTGKVLRNHSAQVSFLFHRDSTESERRDYVAAFCATLCADAALGMISSSSPLI